MISPRKPRIYVLGGVNGAGKSSIGGAAFRQFGSDYYNPDEAASQLMIHAPEFSQAQANIAAWSEGLKRLKQVIAERFDFAFESTLCGHAIPQLLALAALQDIELHVWYVGLSTPELHIERVRACVRRGGHDIPEADISRRYDHSRLNLIALLPRITALRVYDNSADADPAAGLTPSPILVLHMERGKILNPRDLKQTPNWAKPIVAAALTSSLG